jgi:hypothetical protein
VGMASRWLPRVYVLGMMAAAVGCNSDAETTSEQGDNLTSLTARQRLLTFEGIVYVKPGLSESAVLDVVHEQTRSAFGALLQSNVAAQTREFRNVSPASFKKRPVKVVASGPANAPPEDMIEVRYSYEDKAVVPVEMARRSALPLALLGQGYEPRVSSITNNCTKNDKDARDSVDMGLLWYVFNPSYKKCRDLIDSEQRRIDEDTSKLSDPATMVTASRAKRAFLPVTMKFAPAATASTPTYPEYERLFSGASEPGVLKISMMTGRLAHTAVETRKDGGYYEWLAALDVIFAKNEDFKLTTITPSVDVSTATVNGRTYNNLGFKDFIQWTVYGRGWPTKMPPEDRDDIAREIATRLDQKWVTFEKTVKVSIGGVPAKDLTIRLETLFGSEEDPTPHKEAIKKADVYIYNGHSYIGAGPLDPDLYRKEDFTSGYQLLWFDSCISYNYYHKDFFTIKDGGSKNLDLITNGLEAPEYMSGEAEGYFVNRLIDGSMPSYQTLLKVAKATDSLRVVDGELDNVYSPTTTPVRFQR